MFKSIHDGSCDSPFIRRPQHERSHSCKEPRPIRIRDAVIDATDQVLLRRTTNSSDFTDEEFSSVQEKRPGKTRADVIESLAVRVRKFVSDESTNPCFVL